MVSNRMKASLVRRLLGKAKRGFYYHSGRIVPLVEGALRGNSVEAFWYRGAINFGDLITPLLLRHFGYTPVYTRPELATLVATGSILEFLPEDFGGVIFGSGFIQEGVGQSFPQATIAMVRGELTRRRLGLADGFPLGDPGLLLGRVLQSNPDKQYRVGFVPHYVEKGSDVIIRLRRRQDESIHIIDPQASPERVIYEIEQCNCILSSSLHGLIVADALGIPSCWVGSDKVVGGHYKYFDYYSSLDYDASPIRIKGVESIDEMIGCTDVKPQHLIASRQDAVERIWRDLKAYI